MKKLMILSAGIVLAFSTPAMALGLNTSTSVRANTSVDSPVGVGGMGGGLTGGSGANVGVYSSSRVNDPDATSRSGRTFNNLEETEVKASENVEPGSYAATARSKLRVQREREEAARLKRQNDLNAKTSAEIQANVDAANRTAETLRTGVRANANIDASTGFNR